MGRPRLSKRGDIVIVALQGDSGKPRPAVVIQANWSDALPSVVVLPITSTLQDASLTRIDVAPTPGNGLRAPSQVAVDRPNTVRRSKLGPVIGRLENDTLLAINRAVAVFLGLA